VRNLTVFGALQNSVTKAAGPLMPVDGRGNGGWWPIIREPYAGAWQNDDEMRVDSAASYYAVYSCVTLISNDIGKLRPMLMQLDADGIWTETTSPAFSPILRKPNRFQNHIQFKQYWMTSKLLRGNAYVLKQRDARGVVIAEYVLDPDRVLPLVAPDGSVYYELRMDNLAGLDQTSITVPASEIVHDRMNCLFHPLVGLSPIYASGLAAMQGQRIQRDAAKFFANGANPSGVLTAPGAIGDDTAARLKAHWDEKYTGANAGRVAVLGDGLKFEPMRMSSVDAQLIEQLKWTAEAVCSCFHVPAYKAGVGAAPAYNNIEALEQAYYSQCLQIHIEDMELCQDEGLALPAQYGVELDLDGLLRMDTATMIKAEADAVAAGIKAPNESRRRLNLRPKKGGDTPYLQQQNYSLAALAERDASAPFGKSAPAAIATPSPDDAPPPVEPDQTDKALHLLFRKAPETLACST
jgi:HK97 family phage portal protein